MADYRDPKTGLLYCGKCHTPKEVFFPKEVQERTHLLKHPTLCRCAREAWLKRLLRPDLLILDDLGAERCTSFGRERIFDVVSKRALTGRPMVITTNLPLCLLQQSKELSERRIYDRIPEKCMPVRFEGENFRQASARRMLQSTAGLLGE